MDYDIAIVGAGPAGLVAAEQAALQGASVVVLDKKLEIGSPVRCAEGLGHQSFALLGLDTDSGFVSNRVNRAMIISPRGKKLVIHIPYDEFTLYILDRVRFENELASRVIKKNGVIMLGTTVKDLLREDKKIKGLITTQGEIITRIIIGADGVESRIGRLCGLLKPLKLSEIFTCAQHTLIDMEGMDDHFEIHFGSQHTPFGYAWMFPKGRGVVNLGLGVMASTQQNPLKLLAKFKDFRAKGASSVRLVTGCVPSSLPPSRTVLDNVMLVGDAARQTNALSGGGIANAVTAGRMAGEIAGLVAVQDAPISHLENYEVMWRSALERVLKKKFRQRIFLENDKKCESMMRTLRLAAKLKPLIPRGLIVRWLSPNF